MRLLLMLFASVLSVLASVGFANATVVSQLVEVKCEEQARYFRWRSFQSWTLGVGDPHLAVYSAAPGIVTSFARAGFQYEPVTYCDLGSLAGQSNDRVAVLASGWPEKFDEENQRVVLSVNGVSLITVDKIWSDETVDEHLIEIAGDTGKYCAIAYDTGLRSRLEVPDSGVTEINKQSMSCRFFNLPDGETYNDEG